MSRIALSIYDDLDNPHYGGGGARVVQELARRLATDHEIVVFSSSYRHAPRRRVRDGVRYVYLRTGWAGPRLGQIVFNVVLPWVARRHRPDLWLETLTPPFSASPLPLLSRTPVVAMAQQLCGRFMTEKYHLPFQRIERWGLGWYRHIVTLNDADRATARAASPHAQVHVIPNGVQVSGAGPTSPGDYVLYLGRIDMRLKGLDLLLDAQSRAESPLPLVIAGAGTPAEESALIRRLPEVPRTRWVGPVSGAVKEDLLRGCAALVMPSRSEAFGLVALEAMAHGHHVIAFDLPTLGWLDGSGHRPVRRGDVADLAAALDEVGREPAVTERRGKEAWEFVQGFDWSTTSARYRRVIAQVLRAPDADRSRTPRPGARRHA